MAGQQAQDFIDAILALAANAAANVQPAQQPPIAEWKLEAPGEKEPKSKMVKVKNKEKLFHWCTNHEMWTIHKPEECTFKKDSKNTHHNCTDKKPPDNAKTNEPKLTMTKALMSILNQDIED
jgi:hypothetical protein